MASKKGSKKRRKGKKNEKDPCNCRLPTYGFSSKANGGKGGCKKGSTTNAWEAKRCLRKEMASKKGSKKRRKGKKNEKDPCNCRLPTYGFSSKANGGKGGCKRGSTTNAWEAKKCLRKEAKTKSLSSKLKRDKRLASKYKRKAMNIQKFA